LNISSYQAYLKSRGKYHLNVLIVVITYVLLFLFYISHSFLKLVFATRPSVVVSEI